MYSYVLGLSPSEDRQRHQNENNWPLKLCTSADRSTNFLMQPSTSRKEKESHALSTKKRDRHTGGLKSALKKRGVASSLILDSLTMYRWIQGL